MPARKKHPSARARANKASTAATLREKPAGTIPELPERAESWHSQTFEWWVDIWSSPMSDEWHESDIHNAYICAIAYDDMWRSTSSTGRQKAMAEFRQQRAPLGLTPYDRRRLEWTIESAEEAKDRGAARRRTPVPPSAGGRPDPRAGLHAVK